MCAPNALLASAQIDFDNAAERAEEFENEKIGSDNATSNQEAIRKDHYLEIESDLIESGENEKVQDKSESSPTGTENRSGGRAIRQCKMNTPNYSHTHKGITGSTTTKSKFLPPESPRQP